MDALGQIAKDQLAEMTMFQISEVQESPAFNGRRSFLTLRGLSTRNVGQVRPGSGLENHPHGRSINLAPHGFLVF